MRTVHLSILLPLLLLPLAGCVISVNSDDFGSDFADWEQRQERNGHAIRLLELGRSQHSIKAELGEPDFTESFLRNGFEYSVLFYRTHRTRNDGETTRDETTPLVFVDGELVGWGESAVEYATAN